ncbi:hypothetical protein [Richelia intracellularis]|nr:hypothetical protein [Richelia intracellularis]
MINYVLNFTNVCGSGFRNHHRRRIFHIFVGDEFFFDRLHLHPRLNRRIL